VYFRGGYDDAHQYWHQRTTGKPRGPTTTHSTPFNQEDATRLLVLAVLVTEVTNDREPLTRLLRTMHPVSKAHCIKSYAGRIFSLLTFAFSLSVLSASAASFTGPVISVLDGDTIEVLHNQHPERIRLSGIDCSDLRAIGSEQPAVLLSRPREVDAELCPNEKMVDESRFFDGDGCGVMDQSFQSHPVN